MHWQQEKRRSLVSAMTLVNRAIMLYNAGATTHLTEHVKVSRTRERAITAENLNTLQRTAKQ